MERSTLKNKANKAVNLLIKQLRKTKLATKLNKDPKKSFLKKETTENNTDKQRQSFLCVIIKVCSENRQQI